MNEANAELQKQNIGSLAGLGRLTQLDERDAKFLLPRPTQKQIGLEPTSKYWLSLGEAFDQGGTSQCVAYSGVRWLVTHPIVNKPLNFLALYSECQRNDEWPGEDYDGTSVHALFKVLKSKGLVGVYNWAQTGDAAIHHLLTKGPLVLGTNWTRDMFTPDRWAYINATGQNEGGHAWTAIGANKNKVHPLSGAKGAVRMINSWGIGWAEKGRAWISFSDFNKLIQANGECATAVELKLVA